MAITSDITTEPAPSRGLFVAARLFVAADAFFFLGFLFAYLYLRALDSNHNWHPAHTNPSAVLGTITTVAVVAAAVVMWQGGEQRTRAAAAIALALVLVATVCSGIQVFDPGFSPSHGGGYGAVFVGYSIAITVHLLGAAYWLETIAADSTSQSGLRVLESRAAQVYVTFLAAVSVIATICLYVV
jgi:heme/copper-type cytochrome/quinol oxidase subunit 3